MFYLPSLIYSSFDTVLEIRWQRGRHKKSVRLRPDCQLALGGNDVNVKKGNASLNFTGISILKDEHLLRCVAGLLLVLII